MSAGDQVEWKLKRGKWRPKLLESAKTASERTVVLVTREAFEILGNNDIPSLQQVEDAVDKLVTLKVRKHLLLKHRALL